MTGPSSQSLREALEQVKRGEDYTLVGSQQEFESSNITLQNPKSIDEEIERQKEIFSKLKFIYLEQETRDKFLRKISELTSDEIDKNDVKLIEADCMEKKAEFKTLKNGMNQQLQSLHQVTIDSVDLYEVYQQKKQKTQELIDSVADLEKEIDKIFEEGQLVGDQFLSLAQYASEDTNLEQVLDLNNQELQREKVQNSQLENELIQRESDLAAQQATIELAVAKLRDLKVLAQSSQPYATDDKLQKYAKWCKEMNEILVKFTDLQDLNLKCVGEDVFQLDFTDANSTPKSLRFDMSYRILSSDGLSGDFRSDSMDEPEFLQEVAGLLRE
ncbi:uncharacterized protein CANTADRAFT_25828 [Suhomyces tanzawaensis NRRL Y-17324]|uniref:Kinetochore protein Sos7 coiled-coil domain-containing protein n=1 Tax=Suhomyces tanzawaensis NRRL Y-17324 TaxID=984487 RepID=A0A1E4SKU3_9ASCO|nr:uncharacterized protein CANTADRAFT_25828 [Suhomyces tanzawaensis NRRL Y-17324]ODV80110.1 hypothetical protein CANTADRAFT_25828 [Suhomyces tanzawaensis NRRL Y-17324]